MTPVLRAALGVALAIGALALAGCSVFKNNEQALAIVNARALGMPAGEFFDRYGRAEQRRELPDNTQQFVWVSARNAPTGFAEVDDHICSMRISVDARGRIAGFEIMYDGQGNKRVSRCAEIFDTAKP